ncbi:glutamate--tRNA ligase [Acidisphaera sp. L21]|uniref:glutamate--tRNA ligase n=1 Tax=Acidisphaera sp. L21 TaxID=1641851 RepID=UPI00131BE9D9|nr:glutamate--tRNA ligase [Acidisphaera sp. L21]
MKLRFAPSPTGLLHVGNVRAALANYLLARRHGGSFLLRFDDTDTTRNKPEFAVAIEQDLTWLGLDWDDSFRQSDRLADYAAAARKLEAAGRLYPCFESEVELQAKRDQRLRRHQPPTYDRAMLKLTPEQRAAAEAGGKVPYWRFRLSDGASAWRDIVLGDKQVRLATISDPVLVRADGAPLYTFTSVVDDLATGITHIVRGEDHVTNTAVQLDIWKALGGDPAALSFAHLPLLVGDDGGKLSKRTGSLSLRGLRQDGVEASAVTAYLARLGTSEDPVPCELPQLAVDFELSRYSRSSPRFDIRQLLALNRKVLHGLPFEAVQDRLPPGATPAFWDAVRGNLDMLVEARGWWDVVAGHIVPPVVEGEGEFLREALATLPAEPWTPDVWVTWTDALKASTGRKGRNLFHPLRLALTGEERGPEMRGLLPLIGRPRAAERLQVAQA